MKRLVMVLSGVLLATSSPAWAQKPAAGPPSAKLTIVGPVSPGDLTPRPEAQVRQPDQDAKLAVREKAEFRAQQRQGRLASRQWFGLSNTRPTATTDPYDSDYSPRWTSTNGNHPFRWSGTSPVIAVLPCSKSTY
jgi:hypothetical protein